MDSLNKYLFSTQYMPGITLGVGIWGEALKHGHLPPKDYHILGMSIKQGITIRQCCGYSGRNDSVLQEPKSEDLRGEECLGSLPGGVNMWVETWRMQKDELWEDTIGPWNSMCKGSEVRDNSSRKSWGVSVDGKFHWIRRGREEKSDKQG